MCDAHTPTHNINTTPQSSSTLMLFTKKFVSIRTKCYCNNVVLLGCWAWGVSITILCVHSRKSMEWGIVYCVRTFHVLTFAKTTIISGCFSNLICKIWWSEQIHVYFQQQTLVLIIDFRAYFYFSYILV